MKKVKTKLNFLSRKIANLKSQITHFLLILLYITYFGQFRMFAFDINN